MHGKMGRKISEGNAAVYPDIKTAVGIHDRILLKQTDVRYTLALVHLT